MIKLADINKLSRRKDLKKYLAGTYGPDFSDFLKEVDQGMNNLLRTDLKKAARFVAGLKRVYENLPASVRPRYLSLEGRLYLWQGDYDRALTAYREARRLFRKQKDFANVARVGRGLMDVYMYLGRYREALKTGQSSSNYFKRQGAENECAQIMTNIGNIYHRMDKNRLALRYYDRARKVFEKEGGLPLAIVDYNRANIFANLNELQTAAGLYKRAAGIYGKAGMGIAENQARYSLAYLYFLQDRYTEALRSFEDVYTDFKKQGDIKSASVTQLDQVELNLQLNQFGSAIMQGELLIPRLKKLDMRYEEAKVRYFIATAKIKLGDYRPASEDLRQAERLFRREKNPLWLGMVAMSRGRLNLVSHRYKPAESAARQALKLFRQSGDERRLIDAEILLVEINLQSQNFKAVLKNTSRLVQKKLLAHQRYNLNCLLGRLYYDREDYRAALKHYRMAVDIIEKMLSGLHQDEIRFFFIVDKYDSYMMVVECLLKLKKHEDSYMFSLKALATVNQRSVVSGKMLKEVPRGLLETREKLRASLKKLYQAPRHGQREAVEIAAYRKYEEKLWSNEKRIRSFVYPDKTEELLSRTSDLNLVDRLADDETAVTFVATGPTLGAFVGDKAGTGFVEYEADASSLSLLIRKLHFLQEKTTYNLRDSREDRDIILSYLRDLDRILIAPLKPLLKNRKLLLFADGLFAQVPFMALRDESGRFLKDRYRLSLAANPAFVPRNRNSKIAFDKLPGAVFGVESETLPRVTAEAKIIHQIFDNTRLYTDIEANCLNLKKALSEVKGFIHIATHASRSSENPLFSRIIMHDGPFFPFDLFGLGLRAELVTLSGCQTAAPGLYYGNSFSLAKAFYQAGSRFVLATLWPVSDKLSLIFMREFYRQLSEVKDISDAYNRALDKLISISDNPAFWSAFVLLGV